MSRSLLVPLASLLLAACSAETAAPAALPGVVTKAATYRARVTFDPATPIPGHAAVARVELWSAAGVALPGAGLVLDAVRDAAKVGPVALADAGAGLYTGKVTFPAAGTWQLTLGITFPTGADSLGSQVAVTCAGAGTVGAACCDDKGCGAPLTCVHGACAATLSPVGAGCYAHDDCTSAWCGADVCEPTPTCTDGKANGVETAVDCGGATCGKCPVGAACAVASDCADGTCTGAKCSSPGALLGAGGATDAVDWFTVVNSKLAAPAALAFNPANTKELWIANQKNDALTVVIGVDTASPVIEVFEDFSRHFLEEVVSLSFSDEPVFGTCGETNNTYNGKAAGNDFMGPVMWPASVADFQDYGPSASDAHFDMLHNTPFCMGIVSAGGRAFFTFNGKIGTVDWYDFKEPHEHGGDDHKDGTKRRFQGVGLKRKPGVPSHLAYDAATGGLYIADSGNGRVVHLDTKGGKPGSKFATYVDEQKMENVTGAASTELVPAGTDGLTTPSGILLHGGFLYVSDAATGALHAFGLDGTPVKKLQTGLGAGALAGIAVGPDARLYFVDRKGNRVVRVEPK